MSVSGSASIVGTVVDVPLSPFTNYRDGLVDTLCIEQVVRAAIRSALLGQQPATVPSAGRLKARLERLLRGVAAVDEGRACGDHVEAAEANPGGAYFGFFVRSPWSPRDVILGDVVDVVFRDVCDSETRNEVAADVIWKGGASGREPPTDRDGTQPIGEVRYCVTTKGSPPSSAAAAVALPSAAPLSGATVDFPLRWIGDGLGVYSSAAARDPVSPERLRWALWLQTALVNSACADCEAQPTSLQHQSGKGGAFHASWVTEIDVRMRRCGGSPIIPADGVPLQHEGAGIRLQWAGSIGNSGTSHPRAASGQLVVSSAPDAFEFQASMHIRPPTS